MFLSLLLPGALAASLAGVTLPDTAQVGGQTVLLNGLGLREKYFIDVYVGALYLPQKNGNAQAAINQDAAKRITMHFIYDKVTADQLNETWREGFANAGAAGLGAQLNQLCGFMSDVSSGQQIVLDYAPGVGTTVTVAGSQRGTIPGVDFMKALWSVYLGPVPPTEKLKKGMLGR